MPTKQVSYTRRTREEAAIPDIHPTTFVLQVEDTTYETLVQGRPSDVFVTSEQCQILRLSPDGTLFPADPHELQEFFGTKDMIQVAHTIVRDGTLEGTFQKVEEMQNEQFA